MIFKSIFLIFSSMTALQIKQFLSSCQKNSKIVFIFFTIVITTLAPLPSQALKQRSSGQDTIDQELSQDEMVKHWLSGFEIEISERHFARIIHLFDLSSLQFAFNAHRDHLVTKITNQKALTAMENKVLKILNANIDNYLLNEEAYEALPEEIKIELRACPHLIV